jgi:hypothetical protein
MVRKYNYVSLSWEIYLRGFEAKIKYMAINLFLRPNKEKRRP